MARRATNVTRARIQEIALALFSTRGYEATSLQEIAAALDVTKAALYYHFPSKAALLQSLAAPYLDAEQTLLDGYSAGPLTDTAQRTLVRALADLLLSYRPIVAWLAQDITAAAQPGIAERVAEHAARLQQLLGGCAADGSARVRAAAAMGALTRPFTALPDLDLAGVRDTLVAAALDALGAHERMAAGGQKPRADRARM